MTEAAEKCKAWRARKELEDPAYMEAQRAKARERQALRAARLSADPAWVEAERERKRLLQAKKRECPEGNAKIKESAKRSRAKPENQAKQSERMKAWRAENRESVSEYQAAWRDENREHVAAYSKGYMAEYLERDDVKKAQFTRQLWRNYRMTDEEFNTLWLAQQGECAICYVSLTPRGRTKTSACVDHNHETGAVRGLLCRPCNHGIGHLRDSPDILKSAAAYLIERGSYTKSKLENT